MRLCERRKLCTYTNSYTYYTNICKVTEKEVYGNLFTPKNILGFNPQHTIKLLLVSDKSLLVSDKPLLQRNLSLASEKRRRAVKTHVRFERYERYEGCERYERYERCDCVKEESDIRIHIRIHIIQVYVQI